MEKIVGIEEAMKLIMEKEELETIFDIFFFTGEKLNEAEELDGEKRYFQVEKLWGKEESEKSRFYTFKNAREQAGYITCDSSDVTGEYSGKYNNLYFCATTETNIEILKKRIDIISKNIYIAAKEKYQG